MTEEKRDAVASILEDLAAERLQRLKRPDWFKVISAIIGVVGIIGGVLMFSANTAARFVSIEGNVTHIEERVTMLAQKADTAERALSRIDVLEARIADLRQEVERLPARVAAELGVKRVR